MSNDIYVGPDFKEHPDYWKKENQCCGNCKKCEYASTDENDRIWCDLKTEWIYEEI